MRISFDMPEYTGDIVALGTTRLMEALRRSGIKAKFYQASSSEMFGSTPPPQNESSQFHLCSPYAASKVHAYWTTVNYRDGFNLFACNGILFNHESPRRGETFVTRKITRAIANILAGKQEYLYLGNLAVKRDWGYAPEYVEAIWLMLQQKKPDNFVIATGETHTVKEFLEEACRLVNLDWTKVIKIEERYFRPNEVDYLCGDASKAKAVLGWSPKVGFKDLVKIMIDADMRVFGLEPIGEGDKILKKKFPQRWWKID